MTELDDVEGDVDIDSLLKEALCKLLGALGSECDSADESGIANAAYRAIVKAHKDGGSSGKGKNPLLPVGQGSGGKAGATPPIAFGYDAQLSHEQATLAMRAAAKGGLTDEQANRAANALMAQMQTDVESGPAKKADSDVERFIRMFR